jgi:hypothetical protein
MKIVISAMIISVLFSGSVFAGPRDRISKRNVRTNTSVVVNNTPSEINFADDQNRCQAEANYMAANNIRGHVWGRIGGFEGVGYGSSSNCNTCVPEYAMTLTGDASAQSNNGTWYRVRSWR